MTHSIAPLEQDLRDQRVNVDEMLEGMRSLALSGWHWDDLGRAALALLVVFLISFALCFAALRSRVRRS